MNDIKKCEACGADTEYRHEGSTEGFFCTQCDWALVTTSIPKIMQDETSYAIYLKKADFHNKEQIKKLSEAAKVNFLKAREMAQKEGVLILEDEAVNIEKARKILESVSIDFRIEPDFPY